MTPRLVSAREETMAFDPIAEDRFAADDTWLVRGIMEVAFDEARALDTRLLEWPGEETRTDVTRGLEACAIEIREPEETALVAKVRGGRLLELTTLAWPLVLNPCDK